MVKNNIYKSSGLRDIRVKRLGKRGMEDKLFFLIWELIGLAMVIIIIMVAVRGLVNSSTFWKKYYSADTGMITELEHSNQGDFVVNYRVEHNKMGILGSMFFIKDKTYQISLHKNYVTAQDISNGEDKRPINWPFAKSKNIEVKESSQSENIIVFAKFGPDQWIDSYFSMNNIDSCPSIETRGDTTQMKFTGLSIDGATDPFNNILTQVLKQKSLGGPVGATVIEANIISSRSQVNSASTIYYSTDQNSAKSHKLACIIAKNLKPKGVDVEIASFIPDDTTPQTMIDYLNKPHDEYWIFIELNDKSIALNTPIIADTVADSIIDFYR